MKPDNVDAKLDIPALFPLADNVKVIVSLDGDDVDPLGIGSVYPGYCSVTDTLTDPEFKLDKVITGVD